MLHIFEVWSVWSLPARSPYYSPYFLTIIFFFVVPRILHKNKQVHSRCMYVCVSPFSIGRRPLRIHPVRENDMMIEKNATPQCDGAASRAAPAAAEARAHCRGAPPAALTRSVQRPRLQVLPGPYEFIGFLRMVITRPYGSVERLEDLKMIATRSETSSK